MESFCFKCCDISPVYRCWSMTDCFLKDQWVYLLKGSCRLGDSEVSMIFRVSAFLYYHTLQIIIFLPTSRARAGRYLVVLHKQGSAIFSCIDLAPCLFFLFSLSALLLWPLFFLPSLLCPTQEGESGTPLDASYNVTKAAQILLSSVFACPRKSSAIPGASKTALTLTTSSVILQGSCLRLSDLHTSPIWPP